ncbi:MAG: PD40 domain-containing protein [Pseudomonadales bacterium]|nr:PD40 domain-containing protein [Pseudomonadales bacterium]
MSIFPRSWPYRRRKSNSLINLRICLRFLTLSVVIFLSSCGGSNEDGSLILTNTDPDSRQAGQARPIALAFVVRCTSAIIDAIDSVQFCAGGDLFYRSSTSPSAGEINLTITETQGVGDVQGVSVSFDGDTLLFSMRRPQDQTFNIWRYEIAAAELSAVLLDDRGNDIDPAFLPNGNIVFSSDRQQRSRLLMEFRGQEPYTYMDEYGRNPATVLHTMSSAGSNIQQISFNLSHDRFPSVRSDGKILFSRWSHLGNKSRYDIYSINPNGTGLFIEYGAFSEGNSHLAPQEMEDGRLICSVLPLSGTLQGGAVIIIDNQHFDEQSKPNSSAFLGGEIASDIRAQFQPTAHQIPVGDQISLAGRFANPYPLWDGSNRFIASYRFTQTVSFTNPITTVLENQETPTKYQLVMFDRNQKTMQTLVLADGDKSVFGAVTIQARPAPPSLPLASTPEQMLNTDEYPTGIINILSVYDTDSGNMARMDASVLAINLGETIPTILPVEPADRRQSIADLSALKDPKQTTATDRAARYFRITKGIPTPSGIAQQVIGETDYEMRQIVGYGEVQPDGSIRATVPADTPITIEILDAKGRSYAPHLSWLQVRPGETLTCNGCHSPRTEVSINSESLRSDHPNSLYSPSTSETFETVFSEVVFSETVFSETVFSETMAETLARETHGSSMILSDTPTYQDVWTDPDAAYRAADLPEQLNYADVPVTPKNGVINYPEHIQPIWERERGVFGSDTCTFCHYAGNTGTGINSAAQLNLTDTQDARGRLTSYQSLLLGAPLLNENLPQVFQDSQGKGLILRKAPLVTAGLSRSSILTEVLNHTEIKAVHYSLDGHLMNHNNLLSEGELRIVNEWIDLGAQYYNSPYETDAAQDVASGYSLELTELRRQTITDQQLELAKTHFNEEIHPDLLTECGYCHRTQAADDTPTDLSQTVDLTVITRPEAPGNRFILTGHAPSDLNAVLAMISDFNSPKTSILLAKPASVSNNPLTHPYKSEINRSTGSPLEPAAYLPVRGTQYRRLVSWIEGLAP